MDDSWHYIENRVCPKCGSKLKMFFDYIECEECEYEEFYSHIETITLDNIVKAIIPEEEPKTTTLPLYLKDGDIITKLDELTPNTLTITNCELIKMHHKELDIEFEFDGKKLENIDIIEINGHKFVREKK